MKISIIIPCYNAEKWIEQCVLSAINQSYDDKEIIIVDNESTDDSVKIVNKLKEKYSDLVISSAPNIYPNCWDEARAKGYELASGEYFFTLASDDYMEPFYINNCMKFLLKSPELIKAIQTPIRNVNAINEPITNDIEHIYSSLEEFKKISLEKCPVNSPTVVYKRELFEQGKLVTNPSKYGGAADYDLYCKLADEGVFIFPVNRWLGYCYRWHEEQATWKVKKEETNYDKAIQEYWRKKWNL